MPRHDGGFYALQRRLFTDMAGDPDGFVIWAWLIGRANHTEGTSKVAGQRHPVKRGQVLTSVAEVATQWRLDGQVVRRRLRKFERDGAIVQQAFRGEGRLITIVNYEKYQHGREIDRGDDDVPPEKNSSNNSNGAAHDRGNVAGNGAAHDRGVITDRPRGDHRATERRAANRPSAENVTHGKRKSNNYNGAAHDRMLFDDVITDRPRGDHRATEDRPHNEQVTREQGTSHATLFTATASAASGPRPTKSEKAASTKASKSGPTLDAFLMAVRLTHGVDLQPNAILRSQACLLVDRVGATEAPEVAEWYVLNEREAWILRARHPFGELVKGWQKYLTNWKTQSKVSSGVARTADRDDGNRAVIERALAKHRAEQASEEAHK